MDPNRENLDEAAERRARHDPLPPPPKRHCPRCGQRTNSTSNRSVTVVTDVAANEGYHCCEACQWA